MSTRSSDKKTRRVTLDPFNAILGAFFLVFAWLVPAMMPASDGRLNVLHFIGMGVSGLVSAFFLWRWLRAQLAYALRDERAEEVARIRASTFAQDTTPPPDAPKS